MEDKLLTIFVAVMGLLSTVIGFVLGQRLEKHKQTMVIKSNLLLPIEDWLNGAERMNGMLGDTVGAISAGLPIPVIYNFEERRTIQQKMSEGTNKVLGILLSESLLTRQNKKQVNTLSENIGQISQILQRELLPLENEISALGNKGQITDEMRNSVISVNGKLNLLLFASHSLIAKIKTHFA
jgi:hypothetical protein